MAENSLFMQIQEHRFYTWSRYQSQYRIFGWKWNWQKKVRDCDWKL